MLREIYLALKGRLSHDVAELRQVDWYLDQFDQYDPEEVVLGTPVALIEFHPIHWTTLSQNVQKAILTFSVHLATSTAYGDDMDMLDLTYIDHLSIESKIFVALMNTRFTMPDIQTFLNQQGLVWTTPDGQPWTATSKDIILESIVRIDTVPHRQQSPIIVTEQVFQATIFDYSATPKYKALHLSLNLQVNIKSNE